MTLSKITCYYWFYKIPEKVRTIGNRFYQFFKNCVCDIKIQGNWFVYDVNR